MIKPEPRDRTREAAQRELQEHLSNNIGHTIAPRECPVHECFYQECDPDVCDTTWDQAVPAPGWMLSQFVLLSSWTNMETGDSVLVVDGEPRQVLAHRIGMLRYAEKQESGG